MTSENTRSEVSRNRCNVPGTVVSPARRCTYPRGKFVTKSILPLLRESEAGARIITVSSQAGLLEPERIRNDSVRQTLGNVDKLSEEVLDELVEGYCASLKEPEKGTWALTPYNISKALVNAYSRILAKQLDGRPAGQKVYVTPYCPGWTITDMTEWFLRNNGPLLEPCGKLLLKEQRMACG